MISLQHHYFSANGLKHHYWSCGNVEGPVVVMLHGIRSYANTWLAVAEKLSANYHLVALDLRGRGDSEWSADEKYFYPDYVADMEALIDHLDVGNVILLGHSLGGQNAFVYTAKHPEKVRALLVEDIGPGSSASGAGAARIIREFENTPSRFDSWEAATAFWRSIRPKISDASLKQRVSETLKDDDKGGIVWSYDFVGIKNARLAAAKDTSLLPDLWQAVDAIKCPTLVLRGAISDFLPETVQQQMAERNSRIQCVSIANATHYVHDDNFTDFMAAVEQFLQSLPELEAA